MNREYGNDSYVFYSGNDLVILQKVSSLFLDDKNSKNIQG